MTVGTHGESFMDASAGPDRSAATDGHPDGHRGAAPASRDRPGAAGSGLEGLVQVAGKIRDAVESVIEGKPRVVRLALTVLLAEGHLLIEDVPGVGKTMLAKALARSCQGTVRAKVVESGGAALPDRSGP